MTITRHRLLFLIAGIWLIAFVWIVAMFWLGQIPRSQSVIGLAVLIAFWSLAPTAWLLVEEYLPDSGINSRRLGDYGRALWIALGVVILLLTLRVIYSTTWGAWSTGPLNWNVVVEITKTAIWPVVVFLSLALFREPLGQFFTALGARASRIGAFNVSIELADVPVARGWSGPTLDDLKSEFPAAAGDSSNSLFTAIADTTNADYLMVNLEDGEAWLTSRLFILATVIPRIRPIKRIVFLSDPGEEFVGEAKPADVTTALVMECPWLEQAYIASHVYAMPLTAGCELVYNNTLLGPLQPMDGNAILSNYLTQVQGPGHAPGWVDFAHYSEHAEWITKELLIKLLGKKLNRYSVKRDPANKESASADALLRTEADYVAIIDPFNGFRNLVDRHRALDEVVRRETG